jgi:hypothetical protein
MAYCQAQFASLPGLTRQSITFATLMRNGMDARVKPAHDTTP